MLVPSTPHATVERPGASNALFPWRCVCVCARVVVVVCVCVCVRGSWWVRGAVGQCVVCWLRLFVVAFVPVV